MAKTKRAGAKKNKTSVRRRDMTLPDLFLQKLQVLYDVETNLVKALPQMSKHATNDDLKSAFEEHLEQTKGHVRRLEQIFSNLEETPKKLKSEAIKGLTNDAKWVMSHVQGSEALDANLISAAQYVEHYEIAGYGSALEWAREMGHEEAARLLEETLQEERDADAKLNDLAITGINQTANELQPQEA